MLYFQNNEVVDVYNMNDSVVQDVHYGAKSRAESREPKFTDEDFGELINPNIVQSPPQVLTSVQYILYCFESRFACKVNVLPLM